MVPRAVALLCACALLCRVTAYTVDCNHEYADCDNELSKLSSDEEEASTTTLQVETTTTQAKLQTTTTIIPKTESVKNESSTVRAEQGKPQPRLLNLSVDDLQSFANSLHNQSVEDKNHKKILEDLSDVTLDDDEDEMPRQMEPPKVATAKDKDQEGRKQDQFYSNLQAPFHLPQDRGSEESVGFCKENGVAYTVGQKIVRGCEETCECSTGGSLECSPRCQHPYIRRGRRLNDPLCFESPVDECCSIIACATGNGDIKKPIGMTELCRQGNDTHTVGTKWNVGCLQICSCEKGGLVSCVPRCPSLPQSEKCINVQDPKDACCEVQVCDVSQDAHEELMDAKLNATETEKETEESTEEVTPKPKPKPMRPLVLAEPIGSVKVLQNNTVQVTLIHPNSSEDPIHLMLSSDNGKTYQDIELKYSNLILNLDGGKDYILKTKETDTKFNFTITASEFAEVLVEKEESGNGSIGCHYEGKFYAVGEEYHIGCSSLCECVGDEESECAALECPSHVGLELVSRGCVQWERPPAPRPPHCCPRAARCLSDGACLYRGARIPNWSEVPVSLSGCETRCFCENGELECTEACAPLPPLPPPTLRCAPGTRLGAVNYTNDDCCKKWGCIPNANETKIQKKTKNDLSLSFEDAHDGYFVSSPFSVVTPEPVLRAPLEVTDKIKFAKKKLKPNPSRENLKKLLFKAKENMKKLDSYTKHFLEKGTQMEEMKDLMEQIKNRLKDLNEGTINLNYTKKIKTTTVKSKIEHDKPQIIYKLIPIKTENDHKIANDSFSSHIFDPLVVEPENRTYFIPAYEHISYLMTPQPKNKVKPYIFIPQFQNKTKFHVPVKVHDNPNKIPPTRNPYKSGHLLRIGHTPHKYKMHGMDKLIHTLTKELHSYETSLQSAPLDSVDITYLHPVKQGLDKKKFFSPLNFDNILSQGELENQVNNPQRSAHRSRSKAWEASSKPTLKTTEPPFMPKLPPGNIFYPGGQVFHPPETPEGFPDLPSVPPMLPTAEAGDDNKKLSVISLQADSPTSVKMLFGLPPVLVGLRGSVDLRYTDKADDDITQWYSQVFAPADEILTTSRLEFRLSGLKPSTTYKVRGKLFLHNLPVEPESEVYTVRTLDLTEEKRREIDSRLSVLHVNDSHAHLTWRHFTEDELQLIDGIQVRYRPVGTPIYMMTDLLHHSRSAAELKDLRPGTRYEASLVLIAPLRGTTELYDPATVQFTTEPYVDPYNWSVTIDWTSTGGGAGVVRWRGVPPPAERWVRVYRAAHACAPPRAAPRPARAHEQDVFALAERDQPTNITLRLAPNSRCRVWLEVFQTNGKVKTSNVLEVNTKEEVELPEIVDNTIEASSIAGSRGSNRGDYYGALVAVGVIAALGALTSLLLLLIVVRRHRPRSANITPLPTAPRESSLPPYDNPAYKLELQQETMDL